MANYVTADLHFNDQKIVDVVRKRFVSVKEHDDFIVRAINSVVGKNDTLYILGDVGILPIQGIKYEISRIVGRKILVVGNHDRFSDEAAKEMGFDEVYRHPVYVSPHVILSHEPVMEAYMNEYVINVHGHIHGDRIPCRGFVNANIDATNYKPLSLDAIIRNAAKECLPRWEKYGNEWYADLMKRP